MSIINGEAPYKYTRSNAKDWHLCEHIWLQFKLTSFPYDNLPAIYAEQVPVCLVCRRDHHFRQCPWVIGGCFHCGQLGHKVSECHERHAR